jgi:hypothetical protein
VDQYQKLGVLWNRVAFSWVTSEPQEGQYDWERYDRIVNACDRAGIKVLGTLGGHFDSPPVPAWAGESLLDVVTSHPQRFEKFVKAWVERYKSKVHYWEVLNEPKVHHKGLTVSLYVEKVLKPTYRIIKAADPHGKVLPCAFNNLPVLGDKEDFWDAAKGYYDIANYHCYADWGHIKTDTSAAPDEALVRDIRADMQKHGEGGKSLWVTEAGWWGTGSGALFVPSKENPAPRPNFLGSEILSHAVVLAEDAKRAAWMKDMFPRLLAIPGCDKVFLWVSMDEFDGGYRPDQRYDRRPEDSKVKQFDLWGVIAGDGTWRRSAYALQELLK